MSTETKTAFAGSNPFAALVDAKPKEKAQPQATKTKRQLDIAPTRIEVNGMYISDDPRPTLRGFASSKYDKLFSALKPGQCIVCESKNMNPTRNALQKWMEVRYPGKYAVRGVSHYEKDGKGRVWLLNKADVEVKK